MHQIKFFIGCLLRCRELDRDENNNPSLTGRTAVIPQAREGMEEMDRDWKGDDIAENCYRQRVVDQ